MQRSVVGLVSSMVFALGCGSDGDGIPGQDPTAEGPTRPSIPTGSDDGAAPPNGRPVTLFGATMACFYTEEDSEHPAATIQHRLEVVEGVDSLHARLTLDRRFVDNTYGETAVGWDGQAGGKKPKEREFKQLVGSDHATLRMLDASGDTALEMKIDYISESDDAPSGYRSLGVSDGDGEMMEGDERFVLRTSTSLDRNLNERGYLDFLESSPATDEDYTPNPSAPEWEFDVVYEAWFDLAAFPNGFGDAHVDFIHASPSKTGNNTVTVIRENCPPEWECDNPDGCEPPPPGGCNFDSDCGEDELCFGGTCGPDIVLL